MKERKGFRSLKKKVKKLLLDTVWLQIITLPLLLLVAGVKLVCLNNYRRPKKVFACIMCAFLMMFNTVTLYAEAFNDVDNNEDSNITIYQGNEGLDSLSQDEPNQESIVENNEETVESEGHTDDENQTENEQTGEETGLEKSDSAEENDIGESGEGTDKVDNENTESDEINESQEKGQEGDEVKDESGEVTVETDETEETEETEESEEDENEETEMEEVLPENALEITISEYLGELIIDQYEVMPITVGITNVWENSIEDFQIECVGDYFISNEIQGSLEPYETGYIYCTLPLGAPIGEYSETINIMVGEDLYSLVQIGQNVIAGSLEIMLPGYEIYVGDDFPTLNIEDIEIPETLNDEQKSELLQQISELGIKYACENTDVAGIYGAFPVEPILISGYMVQIQTNLLTILPRIPDESYFTVEGTVSSLTEDVYISEITITAAGIEGFDLVSVDGSDYAESITINEEALDKEVHLQFAKGLAVTEAYSFVYSCDYTAPAIADIQMNGNKTGLEALGEWFFGTKGVEYVVTVEDNLTGVAYLHYSIGNDSFTAPVEEGKAYLSIDQELQGRLFLYCMDRAGNVSEVQTYYQVIEQNAPTISFMTYDQSEENWSVCNENRNLAVGKAYVRVYVCEEGEVKSGVERVSCTVNDEECDIQPEIFNMAMLEDGSQIITAEYFDLILDENGEYYVDIQVTDHAGNESIETMFFNVLDDTILKVIVPTSVNLVIDPYNICRQGQIYSDTIEITNLSNCDISVNVSSVELFVNHDNDIGKTAAVSIEMTEDHVVIPIREGSNDQIYKFVVPTEKPIDSSAPEKSISSEYCMKEEPEREESMEYEGDDGELDEDRSKRHLRIKGSVSEGSEAQWNDGDINVKVVFNFTRADK